MHLGIKILRQSVASGTLLMMTAQATPTNREMYSVFSFKLLLTKDNKLSSFHFSLEDNLDNAWLCFFVELTSFTSN